MRNIVRIKFGSHPYGTSTPQSDLDFKSVHIPSGSDILLQQVQPSVRTKNRVKGEGEKNLPGDIDDESFSLQRFLELLEEGQTVALDMIFAPRESVVQSSDLWRYLVQTRHRFISKKSAAFVGYCRQQANKYGIKGSRVASVKDTSELFTQEAFWRPTEKLGVFRTQIEYLLRMHPEHTGIFFSDDPRRGSFFECCNRKVPLTASVKTAAEIFTRIYENYGDRARLAQSNEGVDWKALSHAIRVGQEAVELLTTGSITFPIPNADYILAVKQGRLPYDAVSSKIEDLLVEVEEAAASSSLPDKPDQEFMNQIVRGAYHDMIVDPLSTRISLR